MQISYTVTSDFSYLYMYMYLDHHLSTNLENSFITLDGKLHFLHSKFTLSVHWCYEHEPSSTHMYNNVTLNMRPFSPCGKVIVSQFINSPDITWNITTQRMFGIMIYFRVLEMDDSSSACEHSAVLLNVMGNTSVDGHLVWRKCGHHQPWTEVVASNIIRYKDWAKTLVSIKRNYLETKC